MTRFVTFALGIALASSALAAPGKSPLKLAKDPKKAVPNSYIVRVDPDPDRGNVGKRLDALQKRFSDVKAKHKAPLTQSVTMELTADQLDKILNDGDVATVEQDQYVEAAASSWGLDRIDQRTLPLDGIAAFNGFTGEGLDVYVADSGVNMHTDFEGRVSQVYTVFPGDYADGNGHGTHCAGTIASKTWGIAKKANIKAVKILDTYGSGTFSGILSGLDFIYTARNTSRPNIVNLSLGGGYSDTINSAVQSLIDVGIVAVVAAGNNNIDACGISPASAPAAITVGAITSTDGVASFSNYGSCVDIFAPGTNIVSTTKEGGYGAMSGTSMAGPHVAGVAALYMGANPTATPGQVQSAILASATNDVITANMMPGSPNRILFSNFVTAAPLAPPPPPPPPAPTTTTLPPPPPPPPVTTTVAPPPPPPPMTTTTTAPPKTTTTPLPPPPTTTTVAPPPSPPPMTTTTLPPPPPPSTTTTYVPPPPPPPKKVTGNVRFNKFG